MKASSLTFNNEDVFASIDYDYALANSIYHENQLVIPDSTIPVSTSSMNIKPWKNTTNSRHTKANTNDEDRD